MYIKFPIKFFFILTNAFLLILSSYANASENPPPITFQKLLESIQEGNKVFEQNLEEAKKSGLPKTQLLEAQTLCFLKNGPLEALLKLEPELRMAQDQMEFEQSKLFTSELMFESFLHALRAIKAAQLKQWDTFEKEARDCFWKSPELSQSIGINRLVNDYHAKQEMKKQLKETKLSMDTSFKTLDGETITLGELLKGKKALLLDFWASWCGPCISLMPELQKKADTYTPKGIEVVGVNTEGDTQKAKMVKNQKGLTLPWLILPTESTLQQKLKIDSIPRMILISVEGNLLFNGHPMDPDLKEILTEVLFEE